MIFVTVGTDLPFDRLIRAIDNWAAQQARDDVFAQVGHGGWRPRYIRSAEFLDPGEFKRYLYGATLIIGHAGMGTILSALQAEKPILVMPRRASLGEQRNEHQLATAKELSRRYGVEVAYDEAELIEKLSCADELRPRPRIGAFADEQLQDAIRAFIRSKQPMMTPATA